MSRPAALYNEFDPKAAEWLRELIKAGLIAPGDVDERSIEDVQPDDLRGYTQVHFFAGIGVWSYALRLAGWPDDRPVWTGSCPCPPFSAAGKGSECPSCGGKSCLSHPVVTAGWICLDCGHEWRGDDRHLLPEFIRLKGQCRPPVVFGEQVASRDGRLWLYTLRAVMEAAGYAIGAADLCAAGVGSPHIRQRLFFVEERLGHPSGDGRLERGSEPGERGLASGRGAGRLVDASVAGLEGLRGRYSTSLGQREGSFRSTPEAGELDRLGHTDSNGRHGGRSLGASRWSQPSDRSFGNRTGRTGPVNGVWGDADWLFCRDGKWRPVEPKSFPLAHGSPARVGRLRGYGNAIVAPVAQTFIEAFLDVELDRSLRARPPRDHGDLI